MGTCDVWFLGKTSELPMGCRMVVGTVELYQGVVIIHRAQGQREWRDKDEDAVLSDMEPIPGSRLIVPLERIAYMVSNDVVTS